MKSNTLRIPFAHRLFLGLTSLTLVLGVGPVQAQGLPTQPIPTPRQKNPFPKNHHDNQNTGRAIEEPYWGVYNGNRPYNEPLALNGARTFSRNGWVFPREAADPADLGNVPAFKPGFSQDDDTTTVGPPVALASTPSGGWTVAPAGGGLNGSTYRTVETAVRTGGGGPETFTWTQNVAGPATPLQMTRYKIYAYIPAKVGDEVRVSDARYRVRFLAPPRTGQGPPAPPVAIPLTLGSLLPYKEVFLYVNQDEEASTYKALTDESGNEVFVPYYNNQLIQVTLDNTTLDARVSNQRIVADALFFQQQFDSVSATPVVTARHGGRMLVGPPGNKIQPEAGTGGTGGVPITAGDKYGVGAFAGYTVDPVDPTRFFTSGTIGPDDFSTLFEGPKSFVRGDTVDNITTTPDVDYARYDSPLFSHTQVLVARHERVIDPDDPDGLRTIDVGVVYAHDWLTGTPLWRFPDRSYLASDAVATEPVFGGTGQRAVPAVPGLRWVDRNGDHEPTDDEMFIVGQGRNGSGAFDGAITFVPRMPVRGTLRVRRQERTATNPDVYAVTFPNLATGDPDSQKQLPSFKAIAYVASNNGVVYALDAYGNNDNRYTRPTTATTTNISSQDFTPGTTNVFWTFSAPFLPRILAPTVESIPAYNLRLKAAIPETRAFGASSPTISFANPAAETAANAATTLAAFPEPRLFLGSEVGDDRRGSTIGGILYALDARADAGADDAPMPFRKGNYPDVSVTDRPADVKWWFETNGTIAATPAVSAFELWGKVATTGPPANTPIPRRGVYFTSREGRVYCVDWQGPTVKGDLSATPLVYDGANGTALNDNLRFHNAQSTRTDGTPDNTEGTIRPRWTFPNRYVDIGGTDNNVIVGPTDPDTYPGGGTGLPLPLQPQPLGDIRVAPALMHFPNREDYDPNDPGQVETHFKHYVIVTAPDGGTEARNGKVYLLDAAGNQNNFMTTPTAKGDTANSHPMDQYAPDAPLGNAAPVWMYRFQYGTVNTGNPNNPIVLATVNSRTDPPNPGTPARRTRPTVYVGGVGQLFAMDIDPATNVFVRWPKLPGSVTDIPGPLITRAGLNLPVDDDEALNPPNADVLALGLEKRPILARRTPLNGDAATPIDSITISGGPLQTRGPVAGTSAPRIGETWNPFGLEVNQDINDPLTRPDATLVPPESTEPRIQYPVLFITAGGSMHEVSSNIEGEDNSTIADPQIGESSTLGWAFAAVDTNFVNGRHVLLDANRNGPGGPSGVALMTNAIFVGLDPDPENNLAGATRFRPRPMPAAPATGPDERHTGLAGFPLNHNGLYYNVGGDPANPPGVNDQQAAVTLRLPYIPAYASPSIPTQTELNQRRGSNTIWAFAGGPNGVLYAYTPGGFLGGGGGTGPGGIPTGDPFGSQLYDTGDPKVDIFDEEYYTPLFQAATSGPAGTDTGAAIRPNRDGSVSGGVGPSYLSRAARGRNNFFEWGERVYIVVFDANGRKSTPALPAPAGQWYQTGNSVQITVINRQTNTTLLRRDVEVKKNTYAYDNSFLPPGVPTPPTPANAPPLGLAFFEFILDSSSTTSPQTPGAYLEVRVQQTVRRRNTAAPGAGVPNDETQTIPLNQGIGANSREVLDRLLPVFALANPLALQARLTDVDGSRTNPVNVNTIGPLTPYTLNPVADTAKTQVLLAGTAPAPTNDPDKAGYQYYQALSNGNTIERRDFRPYGNTSYPLIGERPTRNPQFTLRLPGDPLFYMPIAATMPAASHGQTGSTNDNLDVRNRSALAGGLNKARMTRSDFLWRWWPGAVPNVDAATRTSDPGGSSNLREMPRDATQLPVMNPSGVINPLPWETPPFEAQPWKRAGQEIVPGGSTIVGINPSRDYPDIPRTAISSSGNGGDLVRTRGVVPGRLAQNVVSIEAKVPPYQPANMVAIDNLSSTYVAPNPLDPASPIPSVETATVQGPLQLPRGIANRQFTDDRLTPFGYTTRMFVYIDSNNDGRLNLSVNALNTNNGVDYSNPDLGRQAGYEEAYREFEVWTGVQIDMKLKSVEETIDVGALPHGFGLQNGVLGYNNDAFNAFPGLKPGFFSPLFGLYTGGYGTFFKNFNIQNTGNVNLWNVRAAQRSRAYNSQNNTFSLRDLGLLSDNVDPRFGINAFGVDPTLTNPIFGDSSVNHVVTSLDPNLDTAWDQITAGTGSSYSPQVQEFYRRFSGMHTFHKAKAGAVAPSVLSLPDRPDNAVINPALIGTPKVSIAVPIGTPVGTYASRLAVFEDHDTNLDARDLYRSFPTKLTGTQNIRPFGPLYGGQNILHPGDPTVPPIRRDGTPVATVRPRGTVLVNGVQALEYQPLTDPSFNLKVTVQESPLTGQTADTFSLDPSAGSPNRVISGLLPFVDVFPLVDVAPSSRPSSALMPAAYRSVTAGSLHTYFTRNVEGDGTVNQSAAAGKPFRLFHSHLAWSPTPGVWTASSSGQPVNDPLANTGRWFTQPQVINVPGAPDDGTSNTAPFVLHETQTPTAGSASETATLFWLSTQGSLTGAQRNDIYYSTLDPATGVPSGESKSYFNPATLDPSVRRAGPRAITADGDGDEAKETLFVLYFGGVPGRQSLLYGATGFDRNTGEPLGVPRAIGSRLPAERVLTIPDALSSASDPTGIYRVVPDPDDPAESIPVIDVYYTGISRVGQNQDIYMTRYRVVDARPDAGAVFGVEAVLQGVVLPPVERERLSAPSSGLIFQGRHIAWSRDLATNNRPNLPVVYIRAGDSGVLQALQSDPDLATAATKTRNAWRYDDATGLLYQNFKRTVNINNTPTETLNIAYVDTSAGTVRFRGRGAPTGSDIIYADYRPLAYRVTPDTTPDLGATVFLDNTQLLPSAANNATGVVLRRLRDMPVGRKWVVWQKGAQTNQASTLYYTTQRVGVDLKALPVSQGGMRPQESFRLTRSNPNTGNQTISVDVGGPAAADGYDIDFEKGRIYFPAEAEGLEYTITYTPYPPGNPANRIAEGKVGFIDEAAPAQMVPMQRSVNEGQPLAFLDLFNGNRLLAGGTPRPFDPTLQPGRVWLFWTSPRRRAYDVYWEAFAPKFESDSFAGRPPTPNPGPGPSRSAGTK